MKRAIAFIAEQRDIVARWVATDEQYLRDRTLRNDPPDEGVVRRLRDRQELVDELDDAIETLEDT